MTKSKFFRARVAPSFENLPMEEQLYEVVSPEGERVGSTAQPLRAFLLADMLNKAAAEWEAMFEHDHDAVIDAVEG